MEIKPLFDRIVVEAVDSEEKTKSGIVCSQRIRKNRRWLEFLP